MQRRHLNPDSPEAFRGGKLPKRKIRQVLGDTAFKLATGRDVNEVRKRVARDAAWIADIAEKASKLPPSDFDPETTAAIQKHMRPEVGTFLDVGVSNDSKGNLILPELRIGQPLLGRMECVAYDDETDRPVFEWETSVGRLSHFSQDDTYIMWQKVGIPEGEPAFHVMQEIATNNVVSMGVPYKPVPSE